MTFFYHQILSIYKIILENQISFLKFNYDHALFPGKEPMFHLSSITRESDAYMQYEYPFVPCFHARNK